MKARSARLFVSASIEDNRPVDPLRHRSPRHGKAGRATLYVLLFALALALGLALLFLLLQVPGGESAVVRLVVFSMLLCFLSLLLSEGLTRWSQRHLTGAS